MENAVQEKIKALITHPNYYKVSFDYEFYGSIYCNCTITDNRNSLKYRSYAQSCDVEEKALKKVLKLIEKVKSVGLSKIKEYCYAKDSKNFKQFTNLDDKYRLYFRKEFDVPVITELSTIDKDGYTILDCLKFLKDYHREGFITRKLDVEYPLENGINLFEYTEGEGLAASGGKFKVNSLTKMVVAIKNEWIS